MLCVLIFKLMVSLVFDQENNVYVTAVNDDKHQNNVIF